MNDSSPTPPTTFIGQFQNYNPDYSGQVPGALLVAAAGHPLAGGSIPGAIAKVTPGCGICPDYILNVLTNDVIRTLDKVQRIKNLVNVINQLIEAGLAELVILLNAIRDLIPHPPILDPFAIIKLIGCPLTIPSIGVQESAKLQAKIADYTKGLTAIDLAYWPLAGKAFVDFQKEIGFRTLSDPYLTVWNNLVDSIMEYGKNLDRLVSEAWDNIEDKYGAIEANMGRRLRRILQNIGNICGDPAGLSVALTTTSASVNIVRVTCPEVYARPDLPFATYARELTTFSFNGLLPSGINETALPVVTALVEIEIRILEWQTAALVIAGIR